MAKEFVNIVPAPYYIRISETKVNSDTHRKKTGESMIVYTKTT